VGRRRGRRTGRGEPNGRCDVIARFWSAETTQARAPAYRHHLTTHILPTLRKFEGYGGTMLLQRDEADSVELVVITLWQSLDSIRQFAGSDIQQAVVSDKATPLLNRFDQHVRHYEMVVNDRV
jgi:heme-degrading monooxygenase HmoA